MDGNRGCEYCDSDDKLTKHVDDVLLQFELEHQHHDLLASILIPEAVHAFRVRHRLKLKHHGVVSKLAGYAFLARRKLGLKRHGAVDRLVAAYLVEDSRPSVVTYLVKHKLVAAYLAEHIPP